MRSECAVCKLREEEEDCTSRRALGTSRMLLGLGENGYTFSGELGGSENYLSLMHRRIML